jgi:hypothetical protein
MRMKRRVRELIAKISMSAADRKINVPEKLTVSALDWPISIAY